MTEFLKKQKWILLGAVLLIAIFLYLNQFGIVGNSDTQLGVNLKNILHGGFYIWQISNSGQKFVFPSLLPMIFQSLLNLFGMIIASPGLIFLVFLATVFIIFEAVCSLLKVEKDFSKRALVFLISLFSISNNSISNVIVINSTLIWTFFGLLLSFYLFFSYRQKRNFLYLFLVTFLISLVFMDFHTGLLAVIFILSYLIIELLFDWLMSGKIDKKNIKEACLFLILLVLFNSYWILNNANDLFFGSETLYGSYIRGQNNTNAVRDAVANLISPSFNFIISQKNELNHSIYNRVDLFVSYLLLLLALSGLFFLKKEKDKEIKKTVTIIFIQFIFFFSLSLGSKNPLEIFDFFWNYVPGFRVFREFMKFTRLEIPLFIILASYSLLKLSQIQKRWLRPLLVLVFVSIVIKFFPFYYNFKQYFPYKIPDYYYSFYEFTRTDKLDGKIQILPTISWYQKYDWSNQNYDMQEPIGYFTEKPFFVNSATYDESSEEIKNDSVSSFLENNDTKNLLGVSAFRNMRHFLLRGDLQKNYADSMKVNPDLLRVSLENSVAVNPAPSFGKLQLFSIDNKYFLPRFYVPRDIIISQRTTDELPRIFSRDGYNLDSAVFFLDQNPGRKNSIEQAKNDEKNPVLEFKEINPTKYRIRVHGAGGHFPMVFSDSFSDGWKAYISKIQNPKSRLQNINGYKILDNNENGQATKDELISYIKNGYITTLGDGKEKEVAHKKWVDMKEKLDYIEKYNIDFISKNFKGTIQNDNLPDGSIFETWWKNPIDSNNNHLMANGYANSWMIDPAKICANNNDCVKNPDGTYDFELVVEFWPQRLFYIGLFISITTFLASIFYLLYNYKKGRLTAK